MAISSHEEEGTRVGIFDCKKVVADLVFSFETKRKEKEKDRENRESVESRLEGWFCLWHLWKPKRERKGKENEFSRL